MTDEASGRIILCITSVLAHLGILSGYWWSDLWRKYPSAWSYSFTMVIGVMLAIGAVTPFLRAPRIRRGLFGARLALTAVIAIPFAARPSALSLLYALLTFEGFVHFPDHLPWGAGAICLLISGWWAHLRMPLWSQPSEPLDFGALAATWAQCALSGAIGFYVMREYRLRSREMESFQELLASNTYLADTNMNLQNLALEAEFSSMIRERSRIAREVHDALAYTLTNLLSLLDVYRERVLAAGGGIPEEIAQARNLARDGLADVRTVLRGLRPREGEGYNGLGSIKRLVEVFAQATGMAVRLSYGDAPQFPGEVIEGVLYRVVQEGLTNAFRHGHATEVLVSFHRLGEGIELLVMDNGCGTATFTGGFGLLGIGERVEELGGRVETISQAGYGFSLRVWLPFAEEDVGDGKAAAGDRG
ncbi:MAG: sensor histidine kinase [Bacteroidota bacterium]